LGGKNQWINAQGRGLQTQPDDHAKHVHGRFGLFLENGQGVGGATG